LRLGEQRADMSFGLGAADVSAPGCVPPNSQPSFVQTWQEPWESVAAMAGIVLLCCAPRFAVPAALAWLVAATLAAEPDFEGKVGLSVPCQLLLRWPCRPLQLSLQAAPHPI
jgi:hypothetical protein